MQARVAVEHDHLLVEIGLHPIRAERAQRHRSGYRIAAREPARPHVEIDVVRGQMIAVRSREIDRAVERDALVVEIVAALGRDDRRGAAGQADRGRERIELDDRIGRSLLDRGQRVELEGLALRILAAVERLRHAHPFLGGGHPVLGEYERDVAPRCDRRRRQRQRQYQHRGGQRDARDRDDAIVARPRQRPGAAAAALGARVAR